jgi:DNA-binding NarL/FixJ family response regulator
VGSASDGRGAIELAVARRPQVCLVDTALEGGAVRAAREISLRVPDVAIVMIAAGVSEQDMIDSLRAGACGFLSIDVDPARLCDALRGVLAGEAAIPRRLVSRLVEEVRSQGRRRRVVLGDGTRPDLTSREWEVIELLRSGLTTQQAAARMFVSPVTVRRHLSATVRKLGVADREAALALLAADG